MTRKKRGQISLEYLIIVGFIVFIVIILLGTAFFYVLGIGDRIKINQVEGYAEKVISNSELVFFAGEPSQVTINAYLPAGINNIYILEQQIIIEVATSSGVSTMAFASDVPIDAPGGFSTSEGVKVFVIVADDSGVTITNG